MIRRWLGSLGTTCSMTDPNPRARRPYRPARRAGAPPGVAPKQSSSVVNQAAYLPLGSCAAVFLMRRPQFARLLLRPAYGLMLAWLLVSVATSDQPLLAARRLIFQT